MSTYKYSPWRVWTKIIWLVWVLQGICKMFLKMLVPSLFLYLDDSQRLYLHTPFRTKDDLDEYEKIICCKFMHKEDGSLEENVSPIPSTSHSKCIPASLLGQGVGRRALGGEKHGLNVMLSSLWAGQELGGQSGIALVQDLRIAVPRSWPPWWCHDSWPASRLLSALC